MWLQDNIFEFTGLGPEKLQVKDILKSLLVINEKPTEVTLEKLFKGTPKEKSSTSIKGFSILEFVNEKNEIEIDKAVFLVSFINNGAPFKLKGYRPAQIQRSDKKLNDQETADFGKLIAGTATEKAPKEEAKVAATVEAASAEVKPPVVEAAVEVGAPLFNPEIYNEEKAELIEDGYIEYTPSEKNNYRVLIKGEKTMLVELKKDDYDVISVDEFDIELDDKAKSFTIEKAKAEA